MATGKPKGRPKVDLSTESFRVTVTLDVASKDWINDLGTDGNGLKNFSLGLRRAIIAARAAEAASAAWQAAVSYSFRADEGEEFLRQWFEGNFDALRREWPDCPKDVFLAEGGRTA